MRKTMTQEQYNEACRHANSQLKDWEVCRALEAVGHRMPIPSDTQDRICDAMNEWCEDHGMGGDEWMQFGDEEDVFFNIDD